MEKYNGKNIKVAEMNAFVADLNNTKGHTVYIAPKNGEYGDLDNYIWIQDLEDFQNLENFVKGIEYIDKFARPKSMENMFGLLSLMMNNPDDFDNDDYCILIAMFCEVGVWKNKKLVNNGLYHKDFPKYLSNVIWNYEPQLNKMGIQTKVA